MNKSNTDKKKTVKLETLIICAFIALIIGFLGGVFFTSFRVEQMSPTSSRVASDDGHSDHTLDPERASQILAMEKKVAESPEDVETWIILGNAYFDLNQPEKAIHAYETALRYRSDNADVWTDLGVMYRQMEKPEEAIAAFDKAQEIDPAHEISLFNKGIVQMHDLNKPEEAAATWSKLLELNPSATTQSGMRVKDLVEKLKSSK